MAHLFVYGTLLKSIASPMSRFLNQHSEILGKGYIHGKLYDVGHYPAAILSDLKTDRIYGILLKIADAENTFKVLDTYEGVNDSHPLYLRKSVTVYLENEVQTNTWVYIYNHAVTHLKQIASGNYLKP